MRRILIVGATSLIAEHCARLWAQPGTPTNLLLAGRDAARLEHIAQDLRVRSPESMVEVHTPAFADPQGIAAFIDGLWSAGPIDIALIAHGTLPDQIECQNDLRKVRDTIEINAVSPVLFAEALARHMEANRRGTIAVIGSVAGDRGRRSNYVYGAAKGLVDRYMQGMRHRFAGKGVHALIVKPGPTDTPMTAGLSKSGARLADPARVARDIVRGIEAGRAVVYTPWQWRWIMQVIVHIPARIFAKLNL